MQGQRHGLGAAGLQAALVAYLRLDDYKDLLSSPSKKDKEAADHPNLSSPRD